jgi:hypothetical protein
MRGDIFGHLGLEVTVEQGFPKAPAANVIDPAGEALALKFTAETSRIFIGPRWRIPLGAHELGIVAGYGKHEYLVHGDENLDVAPEDGTIDPCFLNANQARADVPSGGSCAVPDVVYKYISLAADGRFQFGKVVLGARAGYRFLTSTGEIEEPYWFGGVGGGALDLGLQVGYAFDQNLIGMVGFDYTSYRLKFDPASPDRLSGAIAGPVASGARDAYLSFWLGALFIVPGLD